MTAPAFSVTIDDAELQRALSDLLRRVSNPAPLMEDIGRALGNITEDAFQSETSPFGDGWAALDADYVARTRKGDAHPILQVTGGLAASITHGGDDDAAWVGASKLYAAIHQFGGTSDMAPGPAAVQARPYLPVDQGGTLAPAAREEIMRLLRAYLEG
jgi:phage virion morphogenesis protein